jgi:hypothetical protein
LIGFTPAIGIGVQPKIFIPVAVVVHGLTYPKFTKAEKTASERIEPFRLSL